MDFRDTGQGADDMTAMMTDMLEKVATEAVKVEVEAKPADDKKAASSKSVDERRFSVVTDSSRDALLTEFGKDTLQDRYLLPGESYQDLFARVASAYADDQDHAQRLYDYISRLWFMPATPVLSNGGTGRGLPISCFLNAVADSLDGIQSVWNENVALASNGGGIGAVCLLVGMGHVRVMGGVGGEGAFCLSMGEGWRGGYVAVWQRGWRRVSGDRVGRRRRCRQRWGGRRRWRAVFWVWEGRAWIRCCLSGRCRVDVLCRWWFRLCRGVVRSWRRCRGRPRQALDGWAVSRVCSGRRWS